MQKLRSAFGSDEFALAILDDVFPGIKAKFIRTEFGLLSISSVARELIGGSSSAFSNIVKEVTGVFDSLGSFECRDLDLCNQVSNGLGFKDNVLKGILVAHGFVRLISPRSLLLLATAHAADEPRRLLVRAIELDSVDWSNKKAVRLRQISDLVEACVIEKNQQARQVQVESLENQTKPASIVAIKPSASPLLSLAAVPPPPSQVGKIPKIAFVDASVKSSSCETSAAAYYPSESLAALIYVPSAVYIVQAEAMAASLAQSSFSERGLKRIYTDSQPVQTLWKTALRSRERGSDVNAVSPAASLGSLIEAGTAIEWIPREKNVIADSLAFLAMKHRLCGLFRVEISSDDGSLHLENQSELPSFDLSLIPIELHDQLERTLGSLEERSAKLRESINKWLEKIQQAEEELSQIDSSMESLSRSRVSLHGQLSITHKFNHSIQARAV